MRRLKLLIPVMLALWGAGGCSEPPVHDTPRRPKNFILISIDTLRADHMSAYGYHRSTTPRLDEYAKRGVVFTTAISSSSWTVPAHLSLFTSLEPQAHGCMYYPKTGRLNPEHVTMAQLFTDHGFRTAAFTGGGMMADTRGADNGFEVYEFAGHVRQLAFAANLPAVQAWLDRVGDAPFFLFYHGYDVHKPYTPPSEYRQRFSDGYEGNYNVLEFHPSKPRPKEIDLRYVISQYDAEISAVDDLLGDFLDDLGERGILEDTLVAITSDHGDEFYEHDRCDHIHTLYDELIRVPWIMFGPTIPPVVVDDQVALIDILPTVLDVFHIPVEARFQGTSRLPYVTDPSHKSRDTYVYSVTGFSEYPYYLSSVRTNRWKLVVNNLAGMKAIRWKPGQHRPAYTYKFKDRTDSFIELFDLRADPSEQNNVAARYPEVVAELRTKLDLRTAESERLALDAGQPVDQTPGELQRQREVLEALGYVDGNSGEE